MTYLYIWVIVAHAHSYVPKYEWQYAGKFDSPAACHATAANLTKEHHRCLSMNTGELK